MRLPALIELDTQKVNFSACQYISIHEKYVLRSVLKTSPLTNPLPTELFPSLPLCKIPTQTLQEETLASERSDRMYLDGVYCGRLNTATFSQLLPGQVESISSPGNVG